MDKAIPCQLACIKTAVFWQLCIPVWKNLTMYEAVHNQVIVVFKIAIKFWEPYVFLEKCTWFVWPLNLCMEFGRTKYTRAKIIAMLVLCRVLCLPRALLEDWLVTPDLLNHVHIYILHEHCETIKYHLLVLLIFIYYIFPWDIKEL